MLGGEVGCTRRAVSSLCGTSAHVTYTPSLARLNKNDFYTRPTLHTPSRDPGYSPLVPTVAVATLLVKSYLYGANPDHEEGLPLSEVVNTLFGVGYGVREGRRRGHPDWVLQ